MYLTTRQVWR